MTDAVLEEGWGRPAQTRAAAARLRQMGLPGEVLGPDADPRLVWRVPAEDPPAWSLALHVARPAALEVGPSRGRTLTVTGADAGTLAARVAPLLALCAPDDGAETLLVADGSTPKRRLATVPLPPTAPGLQAALVAWVQAAAVAEAPGTPALVRAEGRALWLRRLPATPAWARRRLLGDDAAPAQRVLLRQLSALEDRVEAIGGPAVRRLLEDHLLGILPLPADGWPGGPMAGEVPWGPA